MTVQSPAVWLIPFSQLKSTARAAWQRAPLAAVMPQITTVREWAASLGVVAKAPTDIHFDAGIDRLNAQMLLRRAGLDTAPALVQRLLDMAIEAAPTLAALHPSRRMAWANQQAGLFQQGGQFQLESAIGFAALMWAAASNYDTDSLWERQATLLEATEHFYVTRGLKQDALVQALIGGASSKTTSIDMSPMGLRLSKPSWDEALGHAQGEQEGGDGVIDEYIASDFEDLVQQTAALILSKNAQTIALIALDRQLIRRLNAVLGYRGVCLVDETGWAMSTSAVAAQLITWLEAMSVDVKSDVVLAALKSAPLRFLPADVAALEQTIRRDSQLAWAQTRSNLLGDWQVRFARPRSLLDWLSETIALLQDVGLWNAMQCDVAGEAMLAALHLTGSFEPSMRDHFEAPMPRSAYTAWVRAALEAHRFRLKFDSGTASFDDAKATSGRSVVTILPLAQMWGRHFDAVVAPSCNEQTLPARPRLLSHWSAAQREALQLATQDDAALAQSKAWTWLCSQPCVSLLWQQMQGNEWLAKSSYLQILELEGRLRNKKMAIVQPLFSKAYEPVLPYLDVFQKGVSIDWKLLAPKQLSASGYADLRACPYRFYAMRILDLRSTDELDEEVDKRDFGTWLHGTLFRFHEALKKLEQTQDESLQAVGAKPGSVRVDQEALLNTCAAAEQVSLDLDETAFLPYKLIWPKTRDAYLAWLAKHERGSARYVEGEVKKSFSITVEGKIVGLVGTLDRIDREEAIGGARWLLDYKTESLDKTRGRIIHAHEDTQLAFYAALLSNSQASSDESETPLRAAYINLAELAVGSKNTQTLELLHLEHWRDALLDGLWLDLSNIAAGHGLRALGEGDACAHCAVRGLCRKDFV